MKVCTHCSKENPDDASYCYGCGNRLKQAATSYAAPVYAASTRRSFWSKIPSWAWVFIGMGAMALSLGLIIGGFWSLANLEGFASLIFLAAGIICFGVFSGRRPGSVPVLRAILVGFFALMGATVDQTGNLVYNKPVEWCSCPPGSSLERSTTTSHPLPGRTDMTQNFTCFLGETAVKQIDMLTVMGIRFLEYMLLAYLLIGIRWMIWKWKVRNELN